MNRRRSLQVAAACAALLALLGAALFLRPRQGRQEPVGPPEKITLAITTNLNSVLAKIADAKGYFRNEGLDVTLQVHTFGKAALQSLLDGRAEIATVAETPVMFAVMKGAKVSILATIETSTKNEAIIARKDRGIATAEDLRGHRIGVSLGTGGDYFLDSYLVIEGMARNDVTLVDLRPEEMTDALLRGRVDAVATWNPVVTELRKELGDRGVRLHSESAYTETFNVVSSGEFPRKRPEAVRRLLRAFAKAEAFVGEDPRESQQIISEFSGLDRESLAGLWNDFQFSLSLNQSLLFTLEDQARWAIRNGLTDRSDVPNFLDSLYLDGLRAVKPDAVRVIR